MRAIPRPLPLVPPTHARTGAPRGDRIRLSTAPRAFRSIAATLLLLSICAPLAGVSVAADDVDPAALHQQWLDAINRGDLPAVMDLFTDDAVYEGGFVCRNAPCVGKDAVQGEMEFLIGRHAQFTRTRMEVSELTATGFRERVISGWNETRADPYADAGLDRFISVTTLGLRGDKIASITYRGDSGDAPSTQFMAALPPRPAPPPPISADYGRFVDVNGHKMYLECLGTGSPTVILEGGLGSGLAASGKIWNQRNGRNSIQPDIARGTRVCTYDRAGYGLSEQGPVVPHTAQSFVDDLHDLLRAADIAGPYVLAGISLGDPIVRLYASEHPDDVAGLVLMDGANDSASVDELVQTLSPPDYVQRYTNSNSQANAKNASPQGPGGGYDAETFEAQVRAMGPLPDVPLVSLVAGIPENPGDYIPNGFPYLQYEQLHLQAMEQIAHSVPNGVFMVVDTSEHPMNGYVGRLIAKTVLDVVAKARGEA